MDIYIGTIMMFTFNFEVMGFAICDGRLLPIQSYTPLFALIGTTYGGDGVTNFALPDLRGRVPISIGQGSGRSLYNLGQFGGAEGVPLQSANMPSHTHPVNASSAAAGRATSPANGVLAVPSGSIEIYNPAATAGVTMNAGMIGPPAGSGAPSPVSVIQPYLAVSFQIALQGLFPTRG
jgi:microcystin-dependent protein